MKAKKFLLAISVTIFLLLNLCFLIEPKHYYGLTVITSEEYKKIEKSHIKSSEKLYNISKFEHNDILYDEHNDFYMVSSDSEIQEFNADEDVRLYWVNEDFSDLESKIKDNHTFCMVMTKGNSYNTYDIKITTLPLASVQQQDESITPSREKAIRCDITIINPCGEETGRHEMEKYACTLNIRGNTSTRNPKKSYEIDLKNKEGNPLKASLLGMRKDDDWAFNASMNENTKVREPVVTDLWREILSTRSDTKVHGFEMKNCELFLNGNYEGNYQIIEPIDEKQEKINREKDILYKFRNWGYGSEEEFVIANEKKLKNVKEIKFVNGNYFTGEDMWGPISRYVHTFYDIKPSDRHWLTTTEIKQLWEDKNVLVQNVKNKYKTAFTYEKYFPLSEYSVRQYTIKPEEKQWISLDDAAEIADIENMIDCSIFRLFFQLSDNNPKNMFFVYSNDGEKPVIYKDFWDVNYALGVKYKSSKYSRYVIKCELLPIMWDKETVMIINGPDAAEYFEQYYHRYHELRETLLSFENVKSYIDRYYDKFLKSGVYHRENVRWDDTYINYEWEYDYLINFLDLRIKQLDASIDDMAKELGVI